MQKKLPEEIIDFIEMRIAQKGQINEDILYDFINRQKKSDKVIQKILTMLENLIKKLDV